MECPNCKFSEIEERDRRCRNCGAPNPGFKEKKADDELLKEINTLKQKVEDLEKKSVTKKADII